MENLTIKKRTKQPTPKFFKKVINVALTLAAAGLALIAAPQTIDGFVLPEWLETVSQWFVVGGLVASAVAKTTVEPEN